MPGCSNGLVCMEIIATRCAGRAWRLNRRGHVEDRSTELTAPGITGTVTLPSSPSVTRRTGPSCPTVSTDGCPGIPRYGSLVPMDEPSIVDSRPVAVVTGASSGIGAATARHLADLGFEVICAARRVDRIETLAAAIGGRAVPCDVTDPESVAALAAAAGRCDVLVNNAGGALGLTPIGLSDEAQWRQMWETNVAGVMRVTKALLPALSASGDGRIVVVTSVAGHESYPGGSGYIAAKHAAASMVRTMRLDLIGQPIRVIEVAPGMVETEFSLVRFDGDADRAAEVYRGLTPLRAEDIADCIGWAVTRPPHVNIERIDVFPRDQASATVTHRA
jgi:NADP-dependent 3-hydroxy acid dehydrogenase YdfG